MTSFIDLQLLAIQASAAGPTGNSPLYMWGDNTYGQLGDNKTQNSFSWNAIYSGLGSHSFAIRSDYTLWGWGLNSAGQLGDGTTVNKSSPVQIGYDSWSVISSGGLHTLGIKTNGKLYAWGSNKYGQIGDNTVTDKSVPTQIFTSTFTAIAAGGSHSVALSDTGYLYAWGYNNSGQLGDTTVNNLSNPVQITTDEYAKITAGKIHTLAIKSDDTTLYVWGDNSLSQLGTSDTVSRSSPTQLTSESGTTSWNLVSSGGTHTVAVDTNYNLWGWGSNLYGQLGNNPTLTNYYWTQIADSENHIVALRNDGLLFTWGLNDVGQLGDGTTITRSSPVQIGSSSYVSVNAGLSYGAAIDTTGALYTWGINSAGQLGDGTTVTRSSPVQIGLSFSSVSTGKSHTLAIRTDGTLYAWGSNLYGILGNSTTINRSSPIQIGTSSWTTISAGYTHTVGIKTDYTMWAWGLGTHGALGINATTNRSSPVQVGSSSWTKVATGDQLTVGLSITNTVYAWGLNSSGQLGINLTTNRSNPVQLASSLYFNDVAAGSNHAAAITLDNNVLYAWGNNSLTQLGNNDSIIVYRSSPTQIYSTSDTNDIRFVKLNLYDNSTIAIDNLGNLYGWGDNAYGIFKTPTQYYSWTHISSGDTHSLAIRSDNKLFTWGLNTSGQLGTDDIVSRSSPTQITATAGGTTYSFFSQVSAGNNHSTAISTGGYAYTWGLNATGQLGDGTTVNKSSPVLFGAGASPYSIQYDGATQYLSIADNTALQLGASTFTIEMWVYFTTAPTTQQVLISKGPNSSVSGRWQLGTVGSSSSILKFDYDASSNITFNTSLSSGKWYNIALVRDGSNVVSCYINGIKESTTGTVSSNLNDTSDLRVGVGFGAAGQYLGGYMSTLRIVKGTAVYSTSFNLDPAPLTAIANTQLLIIPLSSTINDTSINAFIITNNGTATTTNSVNPYIYYSASFSGSGQYLTVADDTALQMSTGDFTIECWVYSSISQPANSGIISKGNPSADNGFTLNVTGTTLFDGRSGITTGSGAIPVGIWKHVAFVRLSGVAYLYVNGISLASQANTYNYNQTNLLRIGANRNIGYWNGYISNLRIVKGTAVYTGNFTPSTNILRTIQPVGTNITQLTGTETVLLTLQNSAITDNSTNGFSITNNGSVATNTVVQPFLSTAGEGSLGSFAASKISAGNGFTLAINSSNNLYSWGQNNTAQLGQGDFIYRSSPTQIGTSSWSQISSGGNHSLALDPNNKLYAWGFNDVGQTTTIGTTFSWSMVTVGFSVSAAIRSDGLLFTWGENTNGQLGLGDTISRSSPVQVGTSSWSAVTTNLYSIVLAIRNDGTLWGWGLNSSGKIGDNTTISRSSPVQVGSNNNWSKVALGITSTHALAITNSGSLYAWGVNTNGQLGNNTIINRSSPIQIGTSSWTQIGVGFSHSIAIRSDGGIFTWGYNANGPIGLGDTLNRSSPVQVGTSSYSQVAAGSNVTAAIDINSRLFTWGTNGNGVLGNSNNSSVARSSPIQVAGSWTNVTTNGASMYATTPANTVYSWGNNGDGQLGLGDTISRSSPVQIGSGTYANLGIQGAIATTTYDMFVWGGRNSTGGALGINDTINRSSPTQIGTSNPTIVTTPFIIGNSSFTSVSAGGSHSMAIRTDGGLFAWGGNGSGQLGLNDTVNRSSPSQIGTGSYNQINAGKDFTIGTLSDSTLYIWGANSNGQLGDKTTINRSSPVQINAPVIPSNSNPNAYSLSFNGLTQYLSLASDTAFAFGTGNFTVEFWVYFNTTATQSMFDLRSPDTPGQGFDIYISSTGPSIRFGTSGSNYITGSTVILANNWYHVALSRSGTTTYQMFLNGVQEGSTYAVSQNFVNSTPRIGFGVNSYLNGYISNIRIIKGQGLYTGTFTPSTNPLTTSTVGATGAGAAGSITGTVSLLTAQNTNVIDNSTNNFTITNNNVILYSLLTPFSTTLNASDISAGGSHGMAVDTSNNLYAWGLNSSGQLGLSTTITRSSPVQVSAITTVTASSPIVVFSGNYNNYYLSSPTQIGTSSWSMISAGSNHTLGKLINNTVFAWGYNYYGQLGDSSTINRSSPVQIASGSFTNVNAGDNFSSLRKNDNKIYLFGENDVGQIGDLT